MFIGLCTYYVNNKVIVFVVIFRISLLKYDNVIIALYNKVNYIRV